MRIVGVDPGLNGALACLEVLDTETRIVDVVPMPVIAKDVQAAQIADVFRCWKPDFVVIEQIGLIYQSSKATAFSMGRSLAKVEAVAQTLQHPLVMMRPQDWKKQMGLIGKDKDDSRLMATQLFPHWREKFARKKDDGMAEACLIAEAYRRQLWSR